MEVIFHSTHCPKCKVIEIKMKQKNINYIENNDIDLMLSKGIKSAPCLEIDGEILDFKNAIFSLIIFTIVPSFLYRVG